MDIQTENALKRIIDKMTPEQMEICVKDGEYANNSCSNEYLARQLENITQDCGYDAFLLAICNDDEFQIAMYNAFVRAMTIQRALDMHRYSATFDEVE